MCGDGREVPAVAPDAPVFAAPAPVRLFDAPQTMRGQLNMPTDERSQDLTARGT